MLIDCFVHLVSLFYLRLRLRSRLTPALAALARCLGLSASVSAGTARTSRVDLAGTSAHVLAELERVGEVALVELALLEDDLEGGPKEKSDESALRVVVCHLGRRIANSLQRLVLDVLVVVKEGRLDLLLGDLAQLARVSRRGRLEL